MNAAEVGRQIDVEHWRNRRVFITGHMGFKGAWLCALLSRLGAITCGFGSDQRPLLLYRQLSLRNHEHHDCDVRNIDRVRQILQTFAPDVLIHLAAQPLVLKSYEEPLTTFETNIMGTANVLEAARSVAGLQAILIVTSDKVYRNRGDGRRFKEGDELGGQDPYSASKAAVELVTQSMAESFYCRQGMPPIAVGRAGNIIGGGDWADDRIVPDAARSLSVKQPLVVRNPGATRPWQHVLDAIGGYMLLMESMSKGEQGGYSAWNFGPRRTDSVSVAEIADVFIEAWGGSAAWIRDAKSIHVTESRFLSLDSTKARHELDWHPRWGWADAVSRTANWYRDYASDVPAEHLVYREVAEFLNA